MFRLLSAITFISLAAAEYGCSNFAQLTHTMNGCPANQGNPDCSFIQANAQQFCSSVATSWEIINGPSCNLRGASYGCIFASGLYSTTDQFCCPLIVTGGAATASATSTATATSSALATLTATATASASATSSASASATSSASASATSSATASRSSLATSTSTGTSTSTATMTATPSFTPLPSTNITIIYADKEVIINKGYNAAVGLSAVFGFCILTCCCIGLFRKRKPQEQIEKQVSKVERRQSQVENQRRPSQVENQRRPSQMQLRTPEKIDSKISISAV